MRTLAAAERRASAGGRVRVRVTGHVMEVVLERPERKNALSPQLWRGLERALYRLRREPAVTVLTLSGAGGWFCVGGDLKALQDGSSHATGSQMHVLELLEHEQAVVRELVSAPALTIALIDGAATGGGFDLSLACDVRVATPGAKLGAVYATLGLVPDLGALYLLQRAVPHPVSAMLALTGRLIDGREALQLGVVQAIAEDGDLRKAAAPWIVAAAGTKPAALRRCKAALIRPQLVAGMLQAPEMAATQAILLETDEFRRSLAAFLARRRRRA